tara:strand:- start:2000 stop:2203 length:204 start_codon:yes stop_codon:yes gene_type:complete
MIDLIILRGRDMKKTILTYLEREDGASAVEYALMCALAVVIFGGAFAAYSDLLLEFFTNFIDNINPF